MTVFFVIAFSLACATHLVFSALFAHMGWTFWGQSGRDDKTFFAGACVACLLFAGLFAVAAWGFSR